MPFDGSGNYSRVYDWTDDRDAGIKIQAARMDAEMDDQAAAFNQVMLRTGVAAMTGDLDMGQQAINSIKDGTAANPSIQFDTDPNTGLYLAATGRIGFSANGVERMHVDTSGASVTGTFEVSGNTTVGGTLGIAGALTGAAGAFTTLTSGGSAVVTAANMLTNILAVDGPGSNIDADLLDGQHGAYYLPAASYTAADVLAKLLTVDGPGSNIDADTVDGIQAANILHDPGTGDYLAPWVGTAVRDWGTQFSTTYHLGLTTDEQTREVAITAKAGDSSGFITFKNGPTPTERMRISASGGVGIGTTTPILGSGLTIGNDINGSGTVKQSFSTSATERGYISMNGGTGEMRYSAGYSLYGGFSTFYTAGIERMRIDNAGNLGIGTSPAFLLHARTDSDGTKAVIGGSTKSVRFRMTASETFIEGTDFTGNISFQPLNIGGSYVAISESAVERARFTGGKLGIGTTNPTTSIDVIGSIRAGDFLYMGSNLSTYIYAASSTTLTFGTGAANRWQIDSSGIFYPVANLAYDLGGVSNRMRFVYSQDFSASGHVYMGDTGHDIYTDSGVAYHVFDRTGGGDYLAFNRSDNTLRFFVSDVARASIDSGGNAVFTGNVTSSSDMRLKDKILDLDGAEMLNRLTQMGGSSFEKNGRRSYGVIAQNALAAGLDYSVHTDADGYHSVDYGGLVGPLIAAIDHLNERIAALERG